MLTKFRTAYGELELVPAEVLAVNYSDENTNLVNTIRVKVLDKRSSSTDENSLTVLVAKPLNISNRRVPIVHEVVLLIKGPSAYTSGVKTDTDNYYIDIIGLAGNLNHNSLPTISKRIAKTTTQDNSNSYNQSQTGNIVQNNTQQVSIDSNFTENSLVKSLQPYIGDTIIEGRFGNSIRLSSTQPNTSLFSKIPKWTGASVDPILIIRNTRQGTNTNRINDFTTEDFNKDDSIIALTSGQEVEFTPNTNTNSAANTEKVNTWKQDNWATVPAIIASSGRISINANAKEVSVFGKEGIALSADSSITLDSSKNIVLNSTKVKLGNNATEQAVLGNQLVTLLNTLIATIDTLNTNVLTYASTQTAAASGLGVFAPLVPALSTLVGSLPAVTSNLASIRGQINSILSADILLSKKISVTSSPKPNPFFKDTLSTNFTLSNERRIQLTQERENIIQKQNESNGILTTPDEERKRFIEQILLYQTETHSEIPKPIK